MSLLPVKELQVNLYIPDAPVGCIHVKFMSKVKGDSAFSSKTKSLSRATTGSPPLNCLVFLQKYSF
jgi:hypothetical protein